MSEADDSQEQLVHKLAEFYNRFMMLYRCSPTMRHEARSLSYLMNEITLLHKKSIRLRQEEQRAFDEAAGKVGENEEE